MSFVELVHELIAMSKNCKEPLGHPDRDVFLNETGPTPKTYEIGMKLNKLGGFAAMSEAARMLARAGFAMDLPLLNMAWDGIGQWVH